MKRGSPLRLAPRVLLGAVIVATLLCGLGTGLARFGVALPAHAVARAGWHGVLMVPVFFGAVISLERAVAIGRAWCFAAPVGAALASVLLLAGAPVPLAQVALLVASIPLLVGSIFVMRRQFALYLITLAIAAACWTFGNLVWIVSGDPFSAVPAWLAFLVLTIVAERLELMRMRPMRPMAPYLFGGCVTLLLTGLAIALWQPDFGSRVFSASYLLLALWLAKYDIARYTVRQRGLTRFIAVALLVGYGWFGASGLLGLDGALVAGHPWHDAALHALTLGFVFSMVFGHAPIILPAVTRLRVKYSPLFYVPLVLLHGAVAARVVGVLYGDFGLRRFGSEAAAAALAIFIFVLLTAIWSARRGRR
ncbi:hypothetical protein [Paraburkholderia adhaesiva]|uniref:hypothetical protein n=1 Tax=Paraburkholderia adhaesiva TaxID=2883244 RepID=UPI001F446CC8|nr:hypothetical protein [Paraburkholderia adhaesiva]